MIFKKYKYYNRHKPTKSVESEKQGRLILGMGCKRTFVYNTGTFKLILRRKALPKVVSRSTSYNKTLKNKLQVRV